MSLCAGAQADGGEPYQELSEQRPCPTQRAASPLGSCCSPGDHPSLSRGDNKALLPVSWADACVPGRAQNCMQQHEYSISTSLEKLSMDATNPRSFTPFQPVHRNLCFHKLRWITVDWRVRNRDSHTPDIQLNSWWISRVQPLKLTGSVGLHFGFLFQEPNTLHSNFSTPRDGFGGTQCVNSPGTRTRII